MRLFTLDVRDYYIPVGNAETVPQDVSPPETGGESNDGVGGESSEGGFDWDGWDGKETSIPETHKAAFSAFQKRQSVDNQSKIREALVTHVRNKFADSIRKLPEASGDNLTAEQMNNLLRERKAIETQNSRLRDFQTSFEEIVSGPTQYGDASILFSSAADVDKFDAFIREKASKLSPKDLLLLYKQDEILKHHGDARVRAFEKTLGKGSVATDGGGKRAPLKPGNLSGGGSPEDDSLEAFLKQENPELYRAMMAGKVS